jgi:hypothetical protein
MTNQKRASKKKQRLGVDVFVNGKKWGRCGYAENGAFTLMVGNLPSLTKEFRAFCMAGNETESWHYQFPDMKAGDKITFKIVETDWFDEPDSIEPRGVEKGKD